MTRRPLYLFALILSMWMAGLRYALTVPPLPFPGAIRDAGMGDFPAGGMLATEPSSRMAGEVHAADYERAQFGGWATQPTRNA